MIDKKNVCETPVVRGNSLSLSGDSPYGRCSADFGTSIPYPDAAHIATDSFDFECMEAANDRFIERVRMRSAIEEAHD